jgi:hypothetical protein
MGNPFEGQHPDDAEAVAIHSLPVEDVETYWSALEAAGRLKYRLCDTEEPGFSDVLRMIKYNFPHLYFVKFPDVALIAAEFMLNNFSGKAAQIHFSLHPQLHTRLGLPMVRHVTESIFDWKAKDGTPYLNSLFGLTPVTNRAACIFVLKVGFKKRFILPGGMWDRGKAVDAMVTTFIKERS